MANGTFELPQNVRESMKSMALKQMIKNQVGNEPIREGENQSPNELIEEQNKPSTKPIIEDNHLSPIQSRKISMTIRISHRKSKMRKPSEENTDLSSPGESEIDDVVTELDTPRYDSGLVNGLNTHKAFLSRSQQVNRMKSHNVPSSRADQRKSTCNICGVGVVSEMNRVLHVKMAHGISSCKCLAEFTSTVELREHHKTCTEYISYKEDALTAGEICGKRVEKRRLNDHKKKHGINANNDAFYCSICPKVFNRITSLINHEKTVHQPVSDRLPCPFCDSRLKKRESLVYHINTHRDLSTISPPVDGYRCPLCDYECTDPAGIKDHILTAHGVKRKRGPTGKRETHIARQKQSATCQVCGKFIADAKNLKSHMTLHESTKSEQCDICGRTFSTRTYLKNHIRAMHTPESRPQCTVCHKTLASLAGLKKHMMIHNEEFLFRCSFCGKSCRSSYDLKVHERVHTGEKPFECDKCGKGFTDISNLRAHSKRHKNEQNQNEGGVAKESGVGSVASEKIREFPHFG